MAYAKETGLSPANSVHVLDAIFDNYTVAIDQGRNADVAAAFIAEAERLERAA